MLTILTDGFRITKRHANWGAPSHWTQKDRGRPRPEADGRDHLLREQRLWMRDTGIM